jgi:hypothetical protein
MVGCLLNGERSLGLRLRATGVAICERGAVFVVHDFGRERPRWSCCSSILGVNGRVGVVVLRSIFGRGPFVAGTGDCAVAVV